MPVGDDPVAVAAAAAARQRAGLGYALLSYGWWGSVIPIYFFAVRAVGPWDLFALRLLLGLPILLGLLWLTGQWRDLVRIPRDRAVRWRLPLTAMLLAANWLGYIWAIVNDRTLEASLGYYTNPLVSVALGAIFLGERLRPMQTVAVVLAAIGVTISIVHGIVAGGTAPVPWITLVLAFSFGFYGLLRKQADVPAMVGLSAELIVLAPFGAAVLWWRLGQGAAGEWAAMDGWRQVLLWMAGLITLAPLIWFASAARRLPLKTVGFIQYLAPTGQFFIALWLYGEELNAGRVATFILVWLGVAIYCRDLLRRPAVIPAVPIDAVAAAGPGPAAAAGLAPPDEPVR
jgi:chloramphenicol-sensitive protein RarD